MGESVDLEAHIEKAQLVVTGEGKYDSQTAAGKVVSYVCGPYDDAFNNMLRQPSR